MNWLKDVLLTPLHIGQVACQAEKNLFVMDY